MRQISSPIFTLRHSLVLFFCLFTSFPSDAQHKSYIDSLQQYRNDYIQKHELVKEADKKNFRFFDIDPQYAVNGRFERILDTTGFLMASSGKVRSKYFRYGMLYFQLKQKACSLVVYQSEKLRQTEQYKYYLFVPFTDLTSGEKSYGGGRYIDFNSTDIINNHIILDFNKAYNPYCAYALGFNCPIPPRENDLPISIEAGEMLFADHP